MRKRCVILLILFLVATDWIMRRTTVDLPIGIQWTLFSQLEVRNFADVSKTRCQLQEKTNTFSRFAKQVGLDINTYLRDPGCVHQCHPDAPITADGELLDLLDEFIYLRSLVANSSMLRHGLDPMQTTGKIKPFLI